MGQEIALEQKKGLEKAEPARLKAREYKRLEMQADLLDEYLERNLDYESGGHFGFRDGEGPMSSSQVHSEIQQVQKHMEELLSGREGARVSQYVWLESVLDYRRGRQSGQFVPMPYQRKLIAERIRPAVIQGRNLLLISNTGTGKTTMIKFLGRQLYGRDIEYVSAANTGTKLASAVWGKNTLQVRENGAGGEIFSPGPLTRALSGEGMLFMLDELDRGGMANADMVLKEVYSETRGGTVTVPNQLAEDTQGSKQTIGPRFVLVVAINGKRERAQEGEKGRRGAEKGVYNSEGLDPSVANQFVNVRVEYPPSEELYELALSTFVDDEGGIDSLTRDDIGRVLHNLTDAIAEIQESFSSPNAGTIQELSFHPRKMLELFSNWRRARIQGVPFALYLQKRIIEEIDGYPTGSITDKIKAAEIFARHDLLPTADSKPGAVYFDSRDLRANSELLALIKHRQSPGQKFYVANSYIPPREVAESFSPGGVKGSHTDWRIDGVEIAQEARSVQGEGGTARRGVSEAAVQVSETPGQQELRLRLSNFKKIADPIIAKVRQRGRPPSSWEEKRIEAAFKKEFAFCQTNFMNDSLWREMVSMIGSLASKGVVFKDTTSLAELASQVAAFWKNSKTIPELEEKWKFVLDNRGQSLVILQKMINSAIELMAGESDTTNQDKQARGRKARELLRTMLETQSTFEAFLNLYKGEYRSQEKIVAFIVGLYPQEGQAAAALGHIPEYNDYNYYVKRQFRGW